MEEAALCGGCGGRIIRGRNKDLTDAFVFNCKHAFHSECFHEDLLEQKDSSETSKATQQFRGQNDNEYEKPSTRCVLCHAK